MSILNDIDSTLHYENIENAWKKYKFLFLFLLASIFAAVVGCNAYTMNKQEKYGNDSAIVYTLIESTQGESDAQLLNSAIESVKSDEVSDILLMQKVKLAFVEKDFDLYQALLMQLNSAKSEHIKQLSFYMLAEFKLSVSEDDAIAYIESLNLTDADFSYPMVFDILGMAYTKKGNDEKAVQAYKSVQAATATPQTLSKRVAIKLKNLGY